MSGEASAAVVPIVELIDVHQSFGSADVLNGVAFNQQAAGGSEFLPGQGGFFSRHDFLRERFDRTRGVWPKPARATNIRFAIG